MAENTEAGNRAQQSEADITELARSLGEIGARLQAAFERGWNGGASPAPAPVSAGEPAEDAQEPAQDLREPSSDDEYGEAPEKAVEPADGALTGLQTVYFHTVEGVGELRYVPMEGKRMTKGCPVCDGTLAVLGVSRRNGRMPDLYPCVCRTGGHCIVVAEDEGYGPVVDMEDE